MYKFGAALCDERRAVFLFQFRDILRRVAQRHGAFPREVSAFARRHIFRDPVERSGDVVVRPAFGIGPIRREDVIGAPAQQEVERLAEQLADLVTWSAAISSPPRAGGSCPGSPATPC